MLRFTILLILCQLMSLFATAQTKTSQASWQQSVDYYLNVTLDDVNHSLKGEAKFLYTNNSPDALTELYFHLWPNGYKDDLTDFAKQELLNGSTKFHFAPDSMRGNITGIAFQVDGQEVKWSYAGDQIDIAVLTLNNPITSGATVEISTPFHVKIPGSFSRLGHEGQSYQITQWYPKPAVYDVNGWNPMPYLNQGEFYSEFGKFDVSITVPKNYVVAATGELQNKAEVGFLNYRENNPVSEDDTILSEQETKILRYVQNNIHDFGWFADKSFNVFSDNIVQENGENVKIFIYKKGKHDKSVDESIRGVKDAITYYGNHCGYYPYSHCSVVEGALKAGGGMEYPMITVIDNLQKMVVVHEVGHNWFYGILANNERVYPWMDESINSYFEYEASHASDTAKVPTLRRTSARKSGDFENIAMAIGYRQMEAVEMHQSVNAHSVDFTSGNYGLMVYGKGAHAFRYLKEYLGQELMDECFQAYFFKWRFKHPLPQDMEDVFEQVAGRSLDWFFKGLLANEEHIDLAIGKLGYEFLEVNRKSGPAVPFEIGFFQEGVFVESIWVSDSSEKIQITLPKSTFDLIKIDPSEWIPEVNRSNNTTRVSGLAKRIEPVSVRLMSVIENPNSTNLNVLPIIGWNTHNKFMYGLWMNNIKLPLRKLSFSAMPLYSSATGDFNGYFSTYYTLNRNGRFNAFNVGVKGSRFAFMDAQNSYNKLQPFLSFDFRDKDKRIPKTSKLTLRANLISYDAQYDKDERLNTLLSDTGRAFGRRSLSELAPEKFFQLEYVYKNQRALQPVQWKVMLEAGMPSQDEFKADTSTNMLAKTTYSDPFVKLNVEYKRYIPYKMPKKGVDIRVFGGIFLDSSNSGAYHYRLESAAGRWDYTYDQVLMGRGATDGLFNRQVYNNGAFFKGPGAYGNIGKWMMAMNVKADLPLKLPIGAYMDLFSFNNMNVLPDLKDGQNVLYDGGLYVNVVKDFLEIYVPLFRSATFTTVQGNQGIDNLGQRISFKLDLNFAQNKSLKDLVNKVQ